jgi:hypothetical protein
MPNSGLRYGQNVNYHSSKYSLKIAGDYKVRKIFSKHIYHNTTLNKDQRYQTPASRRTVLKSKTLTTAQGLIYQEFI